jgi:hypothetical protein
MTIATVAGGNVSDGREVAQPYPWTRLRNYYKRNISRVVFRKPFAFNPTIPSPKNGEL